MSSVHNSDYSSFNITIRHTFVYLLSNLILFVLYGLFNIKFFYKFKYVNIHMTSTCGEWSTVDLHVVSGVQKIYMLMSGVHYLSI